jgi:adenylate kinase family enzyme
MPRIHILGASGSGTTTLAAALAGSLGVAHVDSDRFFWLPTDPPFTTARPDAARQALAAAALPADGDWVWSGSAVKWGGDFAASLDLIVFLRLDQATRMQRLRAREGERYGERVAEGGDMAATSAAFLAWAARYDEAGPEQRSLAAHEDWLARQRAPILRLDSAAAVAELVGSVVAVLPPRA